MAQTINEYAAALFALSQETDTTEEIYAALDTVTSVIKENPEYLEFLSSPNISKAERISAVEEAFTGNVPEYVVSFLSLLCEKGRIKNLIECISEYKQLCDSANRIAVADITSAVELNESERTALKAKLEKLCGCTVALNCHIDPTLIGGLVVSVDGRVIDGSVKHKLHELKEVMHK